MDNLSYGFAQSSYQSSVEFRFDSNGSRKRRMEIGLLFATSLNITILFGFTVLDLLQVLQTRRIDMQVPMRMPSDAFDLPYTTIADIAMGTNNPAFTYDILVLITVCFVPILLVYGVFSPKKYDIFASLLILTTCVGFLIPDITIQNHWQLWNKKTRLFTALFLTMFSVPLTIKIVAEDTWMEFRVPGTSEGMMELYRRLMYFNSLLHLDFFAVCLLAVFNIKSGIGSSVEDFCIAISLVLYGAICLILGKISVSKSWKVNREIRQLVFCFFVASLLFLIWVPIQMRMNSCWTINSDCTQGDNLLAFSALTAGIIALIMRVYVTVELLKVYRNFGYGLSDAAFVGLIVGESSSLLGRQR